MKKLTDKKGNTYYRVFCIPAKYAVHNQPKGMNIYVKDKALLFFKYNFNKNNPKVVLDGECKLLLSFRKNRVNLYSISGRKCMNITNKAKAFDTYVNEILKMHCHRASEGKPYDIRYRSEMTKRAQIVKLIKDFAKECGFKVPKINCRNISPSYLIQGLAYPAYPVHSLRSDSIPKNERHIDGRPIKIGLRSYASESVSPIPASVSKYLRQPTLNQAVGALLRKKYRRVFKIIQANPKQTVSYFTTILLLRKIVSIDMMQRILEVGPIYYETRDFLNIREFLKQFNEKRLGVLLLDKTSRSRWELRDTVRQWVEHKDLIALPPKPKSLRELHDYISTEYRKLKNPDRPLPVLDKYVDIVDKAPSEKLTIVAPKSTHELVEWGQKLNNCIASYGSAARANRIQLLGVVKEGALTYALELSPDGYIRQFYAKSNMHPDPEDREIVVTFIQKSFSNELELAPIPNTNL